MAHSAPQGQQLLNGFKRLTRFEKGLGAQLPEAYKKFWKEWKTQRSAAVHYLPKNIDWVRDEVTGEVHKIQDAPIPLIDPPESHEGLWGGEAVIKGFEKRHQTKRRVPSFWVPVLRRSVVHSEVLNKYLSVVVTDRTIDQIHECHGFDHYLLKNPACDLRSLLALKLKRNILQELLNGCPTHAANPDDQENLLKQYKCYLQGYTPEEIDWYGYSYSEAIRKLQEQIRAENVIRPHKFEYRLKLIEQLRNAGIREAGKEEKTVDKPSSTGKDDEIQELTMDAPNSSVLNWLSKMNPFGRKPQT